MAQNIIEWPRCFLTLNDLVLLGPPSALGPDAMSAIRTKSNRAEDRKIKNSPYVRKGVIRGFVGYVASFWTSGDKESDLPTSMPSPSKANKSLPKTNSNSPNFWPSTQQSTFSDSQAIKVLNSASTTTQEVSSPSNVPDANLVASYLRQRTGANIDAKFVESMVTDLKGTSQESGQPFRFTFTTPGRESIPLSRTNLNTPIVTPSSSPRKKLSRNPNGVYRWEGAGSAKQARPRTNRYASPAFGASPSKPDRLVMKESTSLGEISSGDAKRRKVAEAGPSNSQLSTSELAGHPVPFPVTASPTPQRTNGTPARPTATSSSSRLRTPAKPTAPVVPSPLRQAWSDASPTSSPDNSRKQSPSHPVKPTNTANFMAGLIKETTPPTKPDLSNPYQSASPVSKVGPPRRSKRTRATGRPAAPTRAELEEKRKEEEEKEKEKEKEKTQMYSPQAIIEATVPKGSKRSRPPAHFEKPTDGNSTSESNGITHDDLSMLVEPKKPVYVVEEVDEDAEETARSTKRTKPSINGHGLPSSFSRKAPESSPSPVITVEEIEEDVPMGDSSKEKQKADANGSSKDMPKLTMPVNGNVSAAANSTNSPTSRASFSAFKSIPKEPSKLRFSFQAEGATVAPPPPVPQTPPPPSAVPKADFKFTLPDTGFNFSFKPTDKSPSQESKPQTASAPMTVDDIKAKVRAMDAKHLPTYTFTLVMTEPINDKEHIRARQDAKVLPPSSLPKFELDKSGNGSPSAFKFDLSGSNTQSNPYDNVKIPSPFHASRQDDTPTKPPQPASPFAHFNTAPVKGFDFAAAGMKAPEVKKDVWACSLCGVSNLKSASQCVACETPAPARVAAPKAVQAPKPPAPPVVGFNWAAAGMKAPTVSAGKWSCSLCGLSNPSSASQCETCETPK